MILWVRLSKTHMGCGCSSKRSWNLRSLSLKDGFAGIAPAFLTKGFPVSSPTRIQICASATQYRKIRRCPVAHMQAVLLALLAVGEIIVRTHNAANLILP